MFKLSSLKVFTAGGESSDLVIPGLLPEDAHRLKDFVLKNSELKEEEALSEPVRVMESEGIFSLEENRREVEQLVDGTYGETIENRMEDDRAGEEEDNG